MYVIEYGVMLKKDQLAVKFAENTQIINHSYIAIYIYKKGKHTCWIR